MFAVRRLLHPTSLAIVLRATIAFRRDVFDHLFGGKGYLEARRRNKSYTLKDFPPDLFVGEWYVCRISSGSAKKNLFSCPNVVSCLTPALPLSLTQHTTQKFCHSLLFLSPAPESVHNLLIYCTVLFHFSLLCIVVT